MAAGNCSVEAARLENGKPVKGTLTLFIDEYSFGSIRKNVNWETVSIDQGTVSVKGFLRSVEKPYIVIKSDGNSSPQFVLEAGALNTVLNTIQSFVDSQKKDREEKEAQARARD